MLAAHDAQAACLNWVSDTYTLVPVNEPAFAPDQGYTGNGHSSHLETGFNPALAGAKFALNDNHMMVGIGTNIAEDRPDIGNLRHRIFSRTLGDNISGRSGGDVAGSPLPSITDARGRTVFVRRNADGYKTYRDGMDLGATNFATIGFTSATFWLLGASAGGMSTEQLRWASWGSGLSGDEVVAMERAFVRSGV